jgi:galactose mutarotase-like enzyme
MPTWTLTDVARNIDQVELVLGPAEAGGSVRGYSIHKRRLQGGLCAGVDVVEIDNGAIRVLVVPTRGMAIWKAWRGELEVGWQSPVRGPVNPAFVALWEPSGIGWLSGFDELVARCGLESNGAPEFEQGRLKYPLHGKIANLPAHRVEVTIDGDAGELAVTGVVDEARLFGAKLRLTSTVSLRVGEPKFRITDRVENLSAAPGDFELLYHINVGRPLLEPGAKVVLPVRKLAPRNARAAEGLPQWDSYAAGEPNFAEQVYFLQLAAAADGQTEALLRNSHGHQGLSLMFNTEQLPVFSLWKSTQSQSDGYVTGLEPGVNFPNPRSFEQQQGRVVPLAAGQQRTFEIDFLLHASAAEVAAAEARIKQWQQNVTPEMLAQPDPTWSAA